MWEPVGKADNGKIKKKNKNTKTNDTRNQKETEGFCSANPQPESRLNEAASSMRRRFGPTIGVSLDAAGVRWQAFFFFFFKVGERTCRPLKSHISIYIMASSELQVQISTRALCVKKAPLLWLWGDAGGKGGGGWRRGGRRCLWSLNWHSQTSVVLYLSHPSDSNSYTLRCLYILTLGLQGHNLKRYPVKNVEKYKRKKNRHVRRESKWREGPEHKEEDTVKPFTQGLQITNNGANRTLRPCRFSCK